MSDRVTLLREIGRQPFDCGTHARIVWLRLRLRAVPSPARALDERHRFLGGVDRAALPRESVSLTSAQIRRAPTSALCGLGARRTLGVDGDLVIVRLTGRTLPAEAKVYSKPREVGSLATRLSAFYLPSPSNLLGDHAVRAIRTFRRTRNR